MSTTVNKLLYKVNSCQLFPCKNGGTCTLATNEPGGYTCSCSWSYTGSKCETYVNSNTVTSSNAVTKSSMVTSSNTVIVIDNVSSCAIYRCNNGGSCFTDINGQAFCQCAQGWTGKYCSKCRLF
jgi:Notch-like protein